MNVVVVGLGYVGAVTAACLSKLGHTVVGVDIDPHKLDPLERGVSPIVEPGLDELVASGRESNRLRVSSDLAASAQRRGCRPRVRRYARPKRRYGRPRLRRAGDRGARRRHRGSLVVRRDRLSQHRPSRNRRRPPAPDPRACVRSSSGRGLRGRHGPRVSPRRKWRRRLLRPAVHCRRRQGRPHARARHARRSPRSSNRSMRCRSRRPNRSSTRATRITP